MTRLMFEAERCDLERVPVCRLDSSDTDLMAAQRRRVRGRCFLPLVGGRL